MIIWLNGAFGSGKTTVAEALHEQIQLSYIYDPENIGTLLQSNLPVPMQLGDFQEHPEWREWNVQLLKKIDREYEGIINVPMTLFHVAYVDEIITALSKDGIELKHFQLEVSKAEILRRLERRSLANLEWGLSKLEAGLAFFESVPHEEKIVNEGKSPKEVAAEIISLLN